MHFVKLEGADPNNDPRSSSCIHTSAGHAGHGHHHSTDDLRTTITQFRHEHTVSIELLTKTVHGQLKQTRKQMAELSTQIRESQAHTERVRLRVVAVGHTADARCAETSTAQAKTTAQIANLSAMV